MDLTFYRNSFRELFRNNFFLKILALCGSIGIWIWVQNNKVVDQVTRAKINYAWPSNLLILDEARQNVALTIQGPQGRIKTIENLDIFINVDLTNAKSGKNIVDLSPTDILNLPKGIKVLQVAPPTLEIGFDKATTKEVKILPNIVGKLAEGSKIVNLKTEPNRLRISGPIVHLNAVEELYTKPIQVNNLDDSTTLATKVILPKSTVKIEESADINVYIEIEKLTSSKLFSNVPITIIGGGWDAIPLATDIIIEGPKDEIELIDTNLLAILVKIPPSMSTESTVKIDLDLDDNNFHVSHGRPSALKASTLIMSSLNLTKQNNTTFFNKWKK